MSIITDGRILVIDDDAPKLNAIKECLKADLGLDNPDIAKSLTSAIRAISNNSYSLCIIDMSLPTYDFEEDKSGGDPQAKGGVDVLRFIQSESPATKAIIISQYDEFPDGSGSVTLDELTEQLLRKFRKNLLAVLFYASQKSEWRNRLKNTINRECDEY
ncbi:response regulator [Pseudomonas leptonychotis]|uniref:response regulator n=1 Tax=Pseudomonas leptonychotis TaxID=2448482 RepID=UPI003867956C